MDKRREYREYEESNTVRKTGILKQASNLSMAEKLNAKKQVRMDVTNSESFDMVDSNTFQ